MSRDFEQHIDGSFTCNESGHTYSGNYSLDYDDEPPKLYWFANLETAKEYVLNVLEDYSQSIKPHPLGGFHLGKDCQCDYCTENVESFIQEYICSNHFRMITHIVDTIKQQPLFSSSEAEILNLYEYTTTYKFKTCKGYADTTAKLRKLIAKYMENYQYGWSLRKN